MTSQHPPVWTPPRLRATEASIATRAASFAVAAIAIVVATIAGGPSASGTGLAAGIALGAGVVVGTVSGAGRWFTSLPGPAAGLLTLIGLGVLFGLAGGALPPIFLLVIPLFVTGLDWRLVRRLQLVPFFTGLVVIVAAANLDAAGWVAAIGWLVTSFLAWWLLQADEQAGLEHGRPLAPGATADPARTADLLRTAAIAVGAGLVAVLLVGTPSCQNLHLGRGPSVGGPWRGPTDGGSGGYGGSAGGGGGGGGAGSGGSAGSGQAGGSGAGSGSGGGAGSGGSAGSRGGGAGSGGGTAGGSSQGGAGGSGSTPSTGSASSAAGSSADASRRSDRDRWPLLAGGIALLVAAAALAWWWTRGSKTPEGPVSWGEGLQRRIEDLGRSHGRPRRADETAVQYTAVLGTETVEDPRLITLGRVASDALFGHTQPDPATQAEADALLDEIIEAHPPLSRRDRRAAGRVPTPV